MRARRPDGTAVDVLATTVVVAAGATETPTLLQRSGLGAHPRLGRNLALHPAVALAGHFEDDVFAWRGVLQSAATQELHEDSGVLIEATATPRAWDRWSCPATAPICSAGWIEPHTSRHWGDGSRRGCRASHSRSSQWGTGPLRHHPDRCRQAHGRDRGHG
ncbi:GMC oxidoreductase family protein [Mycobacterium xenopi 4042]|uniref:GMC oxidoreductase family protein n=1 Tax=Mycobacterium xenopi 4042 TaxID=1299334 RepID=X8DKL7_MYCXE|nr:GMC oxidoreductase family protein [Mycobacterium xenopi 4042]